MHVEAPTTHTQAEVEVQLWYGVRSRKKVETTIVVFVVFCRGLSWVCRGFVVWGRRVVSSAPGGSTGPSRVAPLPATAGDTLHVSETS